jgi:AraC-like DNA-binding protein
MPVVGTTRSDRLANRAESRVASARTGGQRGGLTDGAYREAPPVADLAEYILCAWYRRISQDEGACPTRVLPDGCMDLMWLRGELLVAGPDRTAWVGHLPAGTEIAGLRFRPGAAAAVLGVPASALVGERLPATAVWGHAAGAVRGRLQAAGSLTAAGVVLQDAVRQQLGEAPGLDRVVQAVVQAVLATTGDTAVRVDRLADCLAIRERQLRRRCRAALGYGPKTFARIIRFQRFVARARDAAPCTLADMAVRAGYADQPHLSREVVELAGVPPAELVARLARQRPGSRHAGQAPA